MGRYCSCLLPRQDGATCNIPNLSQQEVFHDHLGHPVLKIIFNLVLRTTCILSVDPVGENGLRPLAAWPNTAATTNSLLRAILSLVTLFSSYSFRGRVILPAFGDLQGNYQEIVNIDIK